MGILRRNLPINNHETKSSAYIKLVRPHLEYCASIWSPHTWVRLLTGMDRNAPERTGMDRNGPPLTQLICTSKGEISLETEISR